MYQVATAALLRKTVGGASSQQSKRTIMYLLNPNKSRSPIRTTRGMERGNLPITPSHTRVHNGFFEIFDWLFNLQSLRIAINHGTWVLALTAIAFVSIPRSFTAHYDSDNHAAERIRNLEKSRWSVPPAFVRPETTVATNTDV